MASREQNEAVAGLLRRSLARDGKAGSPCLEPEVLAAYFEHSLGAQEEKTCDVHLSRCGRCREHLAAMAREEGSPEARGTESRLAWLLGWRLVTGAVAVMVLVAGWLVRESRKSAPNQPLNSLVASKEAPAAKTKFPAREYDATPTPPEPTARQGAAASGLATPAKSASLASKKTSASDERADKLVVVVPNKPDSESHSQLADSLIAANETAGTAIYTGRGAKQSQSGPVTQRARPAASGHGLAAQQSQLSQSVMAEAQVQQQPPSSPQPNRAQAAAARPGFEADLGREASGAGAKAPSNGPPQPAARAPREGTVGGLAGAKTALDAEQSANKAKQETSSDANARKDSSELQLLEERSSEKVIDTPVPTVKWRISSAGFVERSEDGGTTWRGQEVDERGELLAGSAPDEKTCWLVGREGLVLVTHDAAKWKRIPPPASADIVAVSAEDASSATVTTADGRRFRTDNRGKKWKLEK